MTNFWKWLESSFLIDKMFEFSSKRLAFLLRSFENQFAEHFQPWICLGPQNLQTIIQHMKYKLWKCKNLRIRGSQYKRKFFRRQHVIWYSEDSWKSKILIYFRQLKLHCNTTSQYNITNKCIHNLEIKE